MWQLITRQMSTYTYIQLSWHLHASIQDLDTNFMSFRWSNFDLFNSYLKYISWLLVSFHVGLHTQRLASFPCDSSTALDNLLQVDKSKHWTPMALRIKLNPSTWPAVDIVNVKDGARVEKTAVVCLSTKKNRRASRTHALLSHPTIPRYPVARWIV